MNEEGRTALVHLVHTYQHLSVLKVIYVLVCLYVTKNKDSLCN